MQALWDAIHRPPLRGFVQTLFVCASILCGVLLYTVALRRTEFAVAQCWASSIEVDAGAGAATAELRWLVVKHGSAPTGGALNGARRDGWRFSKLTSAVRAAQALEHAPLHCYEWPLEPHDAAGPVVTPLPLNPAVGALVIEYALGLLASVLVAALCTYGVAALVMSHWLRSLPARVRASLRPQARPRDSPPLPPPADDGSANGPPPALAADPE